MGQDNNNKTTDISDEKQMDKPWLFKKGQSGNPNGRPTGSVSITAEIKKKLQEIPDGQQKSYLELLINRILKQAVVDGNEQMIKLCWNYLEGLPKEDVRVTGEVSMHFHNSLKNVDTTSEAN